MGDYDVLVIGGGPGGYVAAIRSAQLGLKTAVVEREHLGGICLNWGCIPTKALLRAADIFRYAQHAKDFGLTITGEISYDPQALVKRSRTVAARLNSGVDFLMRKNKIDVIWGEARITAPGEIGVAAPPSFGERAQFPKPKATLGEGTYKAKHIIVATGARPRALPGLEPDGKLVWTYFEALAPQAMPKSLLIVGGGAIGVEFASFYRTFGAKVTLVEALPQILPAEDAEIAAFARKSFEKQGIGILTSAKVAKLDTKDGSVVATIAAEGGAESMVEAERVISAVGVVPNSENLGLEALGVALERGVIKVDGLLRTNVAGLYAIGDVAGPPMLAHKAEHEGTVCVEAIAGLAPHPIERTRIPACTYCHPQIASVGLTEAAAQAAGYELKIGRFPYLGNGKAIAMGETEGLIKTIFDAKSGRLLGAHLIGAEVTELIQGFVIAMTLETTEAELIETIFPHPTLSETMHESALDAFGRALHI
ncbi:MULTISPECIES: dihydrolipoyl dehydrogenase [Methylosinus]|uniref:Dihydrolipoyl dehydrogenase n=1 Tax=Methylosinus trichosporium (strain ATCC 35070 / NCIMB 11131 / UNIQEM 75 / OB3b) TaxID=595536 RepID=A0A2D2D5I3_METT3|nr:MULTISPECIES: dihydrolipoyl dehydrogenase [Methylosinus]ATQ70268.1 dihydrolipoyl dehydrogenase [Methylosinus trichosporium OB3b]OBS51775.1 dihydrolipoyl dehydrogenase [Methylosinus sp. 3S-1]